ncbi:ArsR/SmtB family transcription factor [Paenibacillus lacisoli]|uniref:ArsR/SmtB family transcription factor n=1 Tax=Paenibacillus lacisoli TaxID=3064525 RepID=UPI0031F3257D
MSKQAFQVFQQCIPVFETLRDPHRQRIILTLCEQGELTVNEIAEQSLLSRPAISHHLKLLREHGLIAVKQQGTQRIYSASLTSSIGLLKELTGLLEQEESRRMAGDQAVNTATPMQREGGGTHE